MANIEHYAVLAATSSAEAFRGRLSGDAVLVRLDERGGKLDPAPWAFPPGQTAGPQTGPRKDDEVDAEALRAALESDTGDAEVFVAAEEEATATTLTPPPVVPAARGAASVLELPARSREGAVLTLGRGADNDVTIAERSVSRHHARLKAGGGGFSLEDVGSQNGTRLNGRALPAGGASLASGDVVAFGDVECVFLDATDFQERLPAFMD